jgi:flagellar hook-length control protein FliK
MKINPQQPQTQAATSTPKGKETTKEKTAGSEKTFDSLMEGKTPGASQNPLLKGKGQGGPGELVGHQEGGTLETTAKKGDASFSDKLFKSAMDKANKSDVGGGTPASQGMPLTAYLEPASHSKGSEAVQHPTMNVQDIEKMVNRVLVGVNESGDPEMKLDMRLDSLGQLSVQVTRTEQGLQIHFNAETDRAGLQLSQNLGSLQQALAQKGLQVNNIQLLVGNEPLALNQMIDSPKTFSQERVHRKDRVQKAAADKAPTTAPKGR